MAYCAEADLVKVRPNIMLLGVATWADQIAESDAIIDRTIEARWYRAASKAYSLDYRETPFDSALLLTSATELTRLGTYKTLELAYIYLQKEAEDADPFERQAGNFRKMYTNELSEVLAAGLSYDWNQGGDLDYTEKSLPVTRRLVRV